MTKKDDAIRERLEATAENIEHLYHRALTEFDLPTEPSTYSANQPLRWSSPFTPPQIADYVRAQIDYIMTGLIPGPK